MKKLKIVFLLVLGISLILVVIQNTAPVRTHFLWLTAEIPAVVLLFLTAVGSFISGLLVALLIKSDTNSTQIEGE
ncbi:MAG: hypothetical protein JW902_12630 [Syntrophaceae bacterium]|nr:hypothetical protein [Syntrophaceae bacterium]